MRSAWHISLEFGESHGKASSEALHMDRIAWFSHAWFSRALEFLRNERLSLMGFFSLLSVDHYVKG